MPALSIGGEISRSAIRPCGGCSACPPSSIVRACATRRARSSAAFDFVPDPDLRVRQLGFAEQQIVAIAKALRRRCRVLILDEPTAALENREITRLFSVLRRLKDQGTGIVYVSHRLEEIVALADRCTVLRDGRVAAVVRGRRV